LEIDERNAVEKDPEHPMADQIQRVDDAWMEIEQRWSEHTEGRSLEDCERVLNALSDAFNENSESCSWFFGADDKAVAALFKRKNVHANVHRWNVFCLLQKANDMAMQLYRAKMRAERKIGTAEGDLK